MVFYEHMYLFDRQAGSDTLHPAQYVMVNIIYS